MNQAFEATHVPPSRPRPRVLVVGAGPSGLVTLKELLEAGIHCRAIDESVRLGGLFDYRRKGTSVYDSTLLTVSNYFMAFSSMPPDRTESRRYWTHRDYVDYLRRFADRFGLHEHIDYQVGLESAHAEGDGVRVRLRANGRTWEEVYEAVAICTGTHRVPKLPELPGLEGFPGQIVHAAHYKNADPFIDRRVVCIGLGETGADIVHEISRVARATTLSLRHYPAVVERYPYGLPYPNDAFTTRALYSLDRPSMQLATVSNAMRRQRRTTSEVEKLLTDWVIRSGGLFGQWLTKSDVFLPDIVDGRLDVNIGGIDRVEGSTLVFADGRRVEADVIMCCTGYRDDFPIDGVHVEDARSLYKHVFHPELGQRVAFIGWARPEAGGIPPCSELQARYWVQLLLGRRRLPARPELERLIAADRDADLARFSNAPVPASVVPYSSYCDGLARLIGCHPLEDGQIRDPRLLMRLWFGSQVGAQYRLFGPGAQPELAREVLFRLPIATPPIAVPYYALQLGMRRTPGLHRRMAQRSLDKVRTLLSEYVARNGGEMVMPS